MKQIIVLQGIPGSGKSFLCGILEKHFLSEGVRVTVCSADDYHMVDGEYKFDIKNLGPAHANCKELCLEAMKSVCQVIIIDNTNTKQRDAEYYFNVAKQYEYDIRVISVQTPLDVCKKMNAQRTHGKALPEEVLERMFDNLRPLYPYNKK